MAPIKSFHDLRVWQKAHKLTLQVYALTQTFPAEEKFGLISQLRRAAISVASNIVEGFKRRAKDSLHFYTISEASLEEVRYQMLLAHDLHYIVSDDFEKIDQQAILTAKMLFRFKQTQK